MIRFSLLRHPDSVQEHPRPSPCFEQHLVVVQVDIQPSPSWKRFSRGEKPVPIRKSCRTATYPAGGSIMDAGAVACPSQSRGSVGGGVWRSFEHRRTNWTCSTLTLSFVTAVLLSPQSRASSIIQVVSSVGFVVLRVWLPKCSFKSLLL